MKKINLLLEQNNLKVLVIDLWGDYAHFRLPYTTTSPLTYPFPPKTSLYGLIGAILGFDKNEYINKLNNQIYFGIIPLRIAEKTTMAINYLNCKVVKMLSFWEQGKSQHSIIPVEFICNPKYRLYIYCKNLDLHKNLKFYLEHHWSYYSISLGISECLANYEYIGEQKIHKKNTGGGATISSVIPLDFIELKNINFLIEDRIYLKTTLPFQITEAREFSEKISLLYEQNSKGIVISNTDCYYSAEQDEYLFLI